MPGGIEPFQSGNVRGFLHHPASPSGDGLVLVHGAGGNCNSPLLIRVADVLAASGLRVLRCDLPFRQARPHGPPSPASAEKDRAGLREAVVAMRSAVQGRVILGGQSYGGRQASILAAENPGLVDGLLLLAYPLHPPGKRDRQRTAHFALLRTPSLFVHGTRDPFASPEELRLAIAAIPAPVQRSQVEGAGHDLAGGKFDVEQLVLEPLRVLLGMAV
jgi:uncharacterized protein